jgi:hypothetical protein
MWVQLNNNPKANLVGDCVVRALSLALDQDWDTTYMGVVTKGFEMKDMPSSNAVWGAYLKHNGFKKYVIPDECPDCYTIEDFCEDHPQGLYVLATGTHVVTAIDGSFYDTWDSGSEIPIYFFKKEN